MIVFVTSSNFSSLQGVNLQGGDCEKDNVAHYAFCLNWAPTVLASVAIFWLQSVVTVVVTNPPP